MTVYTGSTSATRFKMNSPSVMLFQFFCRVALVFAVIRGLLGKVASKAPDVEAGSVLHKAGEQQQDIAMNFHMSVFFK